MNEHVFEERGAFDALARLDAGNVTSTQGAHRWLRLSAVIFGLAALVAVGGYGSWNPVGAPAGGRIMRVAPQVEGRVLDVLVTEDQRVQAGDLLVEIDPARLSLRLIQAMASEYEARARLGQARSLFALAVTSLEISDIHVAAAREQVARSATEHNAAELTLARIEQAAAVAQVTLAGSQIRIAEAGVIGAAAAVEQARLELSYAEIRAPRSGRVKTRRVEPGDHVKVGQEVVALVSETPQPDARRAGWARR